MIRMFLQTLLLIGATSLPVTVLAQVEPKPATEATKAANAKVLTVLPFDDTRDFDNARRGFIAAPDTVTIPTADGKGVAWDLEAYKTYIGDAAPAPDTVNPSLWRNAQLNMQHGLFEVADRIYQVRGLDLSNMTLVQGDTGWIILDPMMSQETAKVAFDLVTAQLGERPIKAIVYSHSHADHYGGAAGIVDRADVASGKIRIIAPDGFTEHAVSENVTAGNAMSRRAVYMYGALLPRSPQGGVNGGLGQTVSSGSIGLILPTDFVTTTGEEIDIDGVKMVFQMTPGTEAPAEMNTYFPQLRGLWMAENATNTMHNILTLRGAQVRDALKWSYFLDETIRLYGDKTDVKFQSHHWPLWGNSDIVEYLKKQRDVYKYIHDQSVNLMNKGYIGTEIADLIELPPELNSNWATRGYYGSLKHNSRAVYQRYMGFYDGNPSTLDELPPEAMGRHFVEYMGGADAVLARAKADFDKGEYRWLGTVLKQVVFADPTNVEAKNLLADAYEQMGYQAESGPWRSVYLQGAYELRNGIPNIAAANSAGPDTIRAMTPEMLFDFMSVRLNGPRAAGKQISINVDYTDLKQQFGLEVRNGVLNHGEPLTMPDATVTLTKATVDRIQLRETTLEEAIKAGDVRIDGDQAALGNLLGLMDDFPFWFPIVTPRPAIPAGGGQAAIEAPLAVID